MQNRKMPALAWQILIGLLVGIALGAIIHNQPEWREPILTYILEPAGTLFIRLIKMIVVPIVITSLIAGIAGFGNAKKLASIGLKTIIYFEVISTIAMLCGLAAAHIFQPGSGVNISQLSSADISQYTAAEQQISHQHTLINTFLNLVPTNIFSALAQGDMLSIIFFSVLFGLGLSKLPASSREPVVAVIKGISNAMYKVTAMVMLYVPLGVFALIGTTVATFGFGSLIPLAKLVFVLYGVVVFFAVAIFGLIARICGANIFNLIAFIKDELFLGYSTASSEAVLPRLMEKMEQYGAPRAISSFVLPTGYSFNLDGSTLYQSLAAMFIAQLYGVNLGIEQQVVLILTLMVTSKGIAAVPGASFVVLLATLGSVGLPLEGLALIAGVDRIMDMARTALNIIGNSLAVLVVSKWDGSLALSAAASLKKESPESESLTPNTLVINLNKDKTEP